MGDNLAQLLYTTFVNSGNEVAGSDVPNWASLPSADRERWEQVATRARRHVTDQIFATLDSVESDLNAADGVVIGRAVADEMRERYGRT
jgi:TRAP-type C4-dicarboxylate transport system substrate-binding protein